MTKIRVKMTKESEFKIALYKYPDCSLAAVYGLNEMFWLTNANCIKQKVNKRVVVSILEYDDIPDLGDEEKILFDLIILPSSINGKHFLKQDYRVNKWILKQHFLGSIITSACAGAFILAGTGLLNGRKSTTHWMMAELFLEKFPMVNLQVEDVLIDDGDIITAGGMMSWIDLGLAIVSRFINPQIMHLLGKQMIIDTGKREQKFYQIFSPNLKHMDTDIIKVQHFLQIHFSEEITVNQLSEKAFLGQRTFLRRFIKATGYKPTEYIQKLRVQKACELIESTNDNFENISVQVGYEDASTFRRVFKKNTGLTPGEFRRRFVR